MNTEQHANAMYALSHSLDGFCRDSNFTESVRTFQRSVDKLVQAMGMQAENQCRADRGHAPAYDEEAFASL